MNDMIAALFLVGPVVVVPLLLRVVRDPPDRIAGAALHIARRATLPSGLLLAVAFFLPTGGLAAALAAPWLAMACVAAAAVGIELGATLRQRQIRPLGWRHGTWVACAFLPVAAGNALADRLGVQPFGFPPMIILLTAVHFTFAGFALVLVGSLAYRDRPARRTAAAITSVIVGIPVTAIGFFDIPLAALIGAWLVAVGGLGIAAALLHATNHGRPGAASARWLQRIAGLSLLVSMPLAAAYATGTFLGAGWLTIPAMGATHGALNVLGFAVPATVAWALDGSDG